MIQSQTRGNYMKIATWNIERLKHRKDLDEIIDICNSVQADILVLTENDMDIQPYYKYCCHTETLENFDEPISSHPTEDRLSNHTHYYKPTERRVSIYTNYEIVREHTTYDKHTALCIELKTEKGNILVYGTIMGILGISNSSYITDITKQTNDIIRLTEEGHKICICGDYNCSFSDNYYFTYKSRNLILKTFTKCDIQLVTAGCWHCIDHIAISKDFMGDSPVVINEWNIEKTLSDHKGISVQFD